MSLGETLKEVQESIVKRDSFRQTIQAHLRRATKLSKQAILLLHKHRLDEARNKLEEAKVTFANIVELSKESPDFTYGGLADSAFEEYAEAYIMISLVNDKRFPKPEEIGVPPTPYVLGLADVIGELRRRALDFLRNGETEKAEECLEYMEAIYMELINLDEAQSLVPSLRRKCDVARRVIEATRGDITLEVRRGFLEDSIHELKKKLERIENEGSFGA
ncbi:MAG: haloacid dehalogenase [Nitrososphaerota archaeon]|nr:haloacid dehalogenase [Candidatus Bathyarchaeota archaeon]MDW8048242.1 haloacid dehalogenase [Nitrososphaerota archaeon]